MPIHLIAAIDGNLALGYKGKLLTKLENDMRHFKSLTNGHFAIMGRRTYEEIGRPLENREMLVLSRDTKYNPHPEVNVYNSTSDIIREYENYADKQVDMYICGGSQVYLKFLPFADYIHLTIIEHKFDKVDAYFPQFDISDWKVISNVYNESDEKNEYDHSFVSYKRKQSYK